MDGVPNSRMRFKDNLEAAFWRDVYAAVMNDSNDNDTACEEADQAVEDYRERV